MFVHYPTLSLLTFRIANWKPHWPELVWEPLQPIDVNDRGLSADKSKRTLLGAAKKVTDLTPVIGTELTGIELSQLSDTQKDELLVPNLLSCFGRR